MREHLGVVLASAELLDPAGGEEVLLGPLGPGNLAVGDVADEQMPEGVLADRPRRCCPRSRRTNSFRSSACSPSSNARPAGPASRERTGPEALADHRGVLEQRLLLRLEQVEPGGDQALDGLGQPADLRRGRATCARTPRRRAGLPPARASSSACVSAGRTAPSSSPMQACGVLVGERRKRDRQRVRLAAAPVGPPREQLGPGGADDEQRHAGRPVDQVVDEVEQVVVRPVQVLEHQHERPLLGELLEEASPRGERLVPHVAAALGAAGETDERPQVRLHPRVVDRGGAASAPAPPRRRLRGCRPGP